MSWKKLFKPILIASIFSLLLSLNADEKSHIQTFVNKYCIDCHGAKKKKASVSFANADFKFEKHASVYFWQDTLDVLNVGEMPPEDEDQPSREELKNVIGEITDNLQSARKRLEATGGVISMRHLNRREYAGSIKDIFGSEVPTGELPPDSHSGFDTNGSTQFFTANHYESYFSVAQRTVKNAIRNFTEEYKTETTRFDPEIAMNELKKSQLDHQLKTKKLFDEGADYKAAGFGDKKQAELFKKRYKTAVSKLNNYFKQAHTKVGKKGDSKYVKNVRPASMYKIKVTGQSTSASNVAVSVNHKQSALLKFKALNGKDQTFEFTYKSDLLTENVEIHMFSPSGGYTDNIQVTGPYPLKESFFEKTFKALVNKHNVKDEEVSAALHIFAQKAFRNKKVEKEYIDKLMAIYKSDREYGLSLVEAIQDPIAAIISAPDFLYITERNNGKRQILSQQEFAIRLSYFLWSSPPDEKLGEKVKSKSLFDKEVLSSEINRMLASPKADKFLAGFINQWVDIQRFDEIDLPRNYQGGFQESARREASEFFKVIARENHPVDKLIDSDFVVIDSILAPHYQIKGDFNGFQKVAVPKNNPRGGLLSQAAFLIMGSSGPRTSPTIRGTIIRERFLHDPPPPPPPNVPQIDANDKNPMTVKEQIKKHKEVAQCASCHDKIDPIGFGLENFDYLGKWRTTETLGKVDNKKKKNKDRKALKRVPIDASGYLSRGEKFNDFEGLKKALYKNKDRLALSIYEALLAYGIGRDIEFVDEEEIQLRLNELKQKNYPVADMIQSVVSSKIFMTK